MTSFSLKWFRRLFPLIIALFAAFVATVACAGETVVQTVEVPVEVPGETVVQTVVVEKEVPVAGETVIQTVVVEKVGPGRR